MRLIPLIFFSIIISAEYIDAQPFILDETVSEALVSVKLGSTEWCDYDMDGDLDLIVTGLNENGPQSVLYNNQNQVFIPATLDLIQLKNSNCSWSDYDNDGDPDLLLFGKELDENITANLYQNLGSGQFEEVTSPVLGCYNGSVVWGDLDNDGDVDLLTIGDKGGEGVTRLYINEYGGLSQVIHDIADVYEGNIDLGDYDSDGDLDILIIGLTTNSLGTDEKILHLYKNEGNLVFIPVFGYFVGMDQSDIRWGDYDGDGDLDILANGSTEAPTHLVYLYQNLGNDQFLNIGIEIFGTVNGSVDWGDYDNDGDLDFLIVGKSSYSDEPIVEIYRNIAENLFNKADNINVEGVFLGKGKFGDYDNDGDLDIIVNGQTNSGEIITSIYQNKNIAVNQIPEIPDGLNTLVTGNEVSLSWLASSDPETISSNLSYNLKVGTSIGGEDIISPMCNSDGYRHVYQAGNVNHNLSWTIQGLAPGQYFWSVQAMDNHYAGSAFSEVQSFEINTVGMDEQTKEQGMINAIAFPNPFIDKLSIIVEGMDIPESLSIKLYSMEGLIVSQFNRYEKVGENYHFYKSFENDLNNSEPPGVYIIEILSKTNQKKINSLKVFKLK